MIQLYHIHIDPAQDMQVAAGASKIIQGTTQSRPLQSLHKHLYLLFMFKGNILMQLQLQQGRINTIAFTDIEDFSKIVVSVLKGSFGYVNTDRKERLSLCMALCKKLTDAFKHIGVQQSDAGILICDRKKFLQGYTDAVMNPAKQCLCTNDLPGLCIDFRL